MKRVATKVTTYATKKVAMIQKPSIVLIGMACIILSACSSPESDGIKAAKMKYDLQSDYYKKSIAIAKELMKERIKAYESYIGKFDSYAFVTRISARETLNEYLEKIESKERDSAQKLQEAARESDKKFFEYYETLRNKYATNKEKLEKFNYAGEHYKPKERVQQENLSDYQNKLSDYQEKVKSLIASIIPPKPDLERLKTDLIGRKILWDMEEAGKYYWTLLSTEEFKTVDIKETANTNENYLLDVYLLLRGEFIDYEANVTVQYILQQHDDWTFSMFQSKDFKVVPTNNYNNCISHGWERRSVFSIPDYKITNSCDYRLLVIGEVKSAAIYALGEIWPLVRFIPANSKVTVGGVHSIKTIERIGYEARNFGLQ